MTTVTVTHGKTFAHVEGNTYTFPAPLTSLTATSKGGFRWPPSKSAFITGLPENRLLDLGGGTYGPVGAVVTPPPVEPPVEPTPAGPEVVNHPDGSVTLSQNGSSVTVNRNGGITSLNIGGTEYIAVGASVQGFMLAQGGVKTRQSAAMASTITNGINDGAHWRGSTADMALDQFVQLEADRVKFSTKVTCTGAKPVMRYDWWADLNPSEDKTQMLSATASEVRCGDVAIRSTHPAAFFYVPPVMDPRAGTTLPIKTVLQNAKALDRSVAVGFLLNVTQGACDTVTFEVRKA